MRSGYSAYREKHSKSRKLLKILKFLSLIFVLYIVITSFLVSSYIVNTAAMEPSLIKGQRILASPAVFGGKIASTSVKIPGIRSPERGDIVVLAITDNSFPVTALDSIVRFFTFQKKTLFNGNNRAWRNPITVKRILGIPGDSIMMENYSVFIKPSGSQDFVKETELIKKKYSVNRIVSLENSKSSIEPFSGFMKPITLKDDEYFVFNDNRSDTNDSRFFGPVGPEDVKALVFLAYIPGFSLK